MPGSFAAGVGHIAADRTSEPGSNNIGCECFDVVMLEHSWEVLGEHISRPRFDFAESDGLVARPLRG